MKATASPAPSVTQKPKHYATARVAAAELPFSGPVTRSQGAMYLKISEQHLDRLVRLGRLPAPGLVGSCRRWWADDIIKLAREAIANPAPMVPRPGIARAHEVRRAQRSAAKKQNQ